MNRKNIYFFGMVLVVLGTGIGKVSWAEISASVQAGTAASVQGEVKATTPPEKSAHPLRDGSEIFMGDKIETGADGQLQILLLDKTVFTLGPLSSITIDEFVYDPENAEEKSSVAKGIFRAVSSKVAKQRPEETEESVAEDATNTGPSKTSFDEAQEKELKLAEQIGSKNSVASSSTGATGKNRFSEKQPS